jgi:hypothetical protein
MMGGIVPARGGEGRPAFSFTRSRQALRPPPSLIETGAPAVASLRERASGPADD